MSTVKSETYERTITTRTKSDLDSVTFSSNRSPSLNCAKYFDFNTPLNANYVPVFENPTDIQCTYETDLNLITIHQIVKDKLYSLMKKFFEYKDEISKIKTQKETVFLTPIDHKFYDMKIKSLDEKCEMIVNANYWERYCRSAIPILNKYVELMSTEYKGHFSSGCDISLDEDKLNERLDCISKYIRVVKSLGIVEMKILKIEKAKNICPGCSKEIPVDNETEISCRCGFVDHGINHSTEYTDNGKLQPSSNGSQKLVKPFKDWLDRFLCRSGESYPQAEMFEKFDRYCIENNFPHRFQVTSGLIPQPDSSVITTLLQNNGYSKYYVNKNLIRRDYYGWSVPEISAEQESKAIELYLNFQERYPDFKSNERKTNINSEIMGFFCLIMVGVNVTKDDFKIPISRSTIEYSIDVLYQMCLSLGYQPCDIPDVNL